MEKVLLICFIIGILFAVVSVLLGDFFDDSFHIEAFPYLSPTTIAAFITVFGGVGLLLLKTTTLITALVLVIAVISALAVTAMLFFLVILPLSQAEHSDAGFQHEMVGKYAEVIVSIEGSSKGEIIYQQGASRLNAPAQSTEGHRIERGEQVEITAVSGGTFIVEKIN